MSSASSQTFLPLSNGSRKRDSSTLDNVEKSQEGEVREDNKGARDVSHIESFTIRVCIGLKFSCALLTDQQPCPSSVYDKPFTLTPLRLLRRSQVPLSFLDTSSGQSAIPLNRLFSITLPLLENEAPDGQVAWLDTTLLLARLESDSSLYAIERLHSEVYALCKLASWVKTTTFDDITPASARDLALRKMGVAPNDGKDKWWTSAILPDPVQSDDVGRPAKRVKLHMLPPSASQNPFTKSGVAASESRTVAKAPRKKTKHSPSKAPEEQLKLQASSEVVFATLVKQYLEALYWSKNSLAFFTKGPLSRARASFSASTDDNMLLAGLVAFLRSMLLEVKSMDKKYRDKLPEMIKAFPPTALSEEEDAPPSTTKRRKPKKPKLSKDGVYPFEEDYVKRWWTSDDSGHGRRRQDDTREDIVRRRLADLRSRETFAQIILILEITALETSDSVQSEQYNKETQEDDQSEKKKPKKKLVDLNLLLDLLLDKLSIWQSIEHDTGARQKKSTNAGDISMEKPVDQDILGIFCTEVIVPFYKSRLPKKAAEVIKKLSGQAGSPDKKRTSKPKPGEPVSKDKVPQKEHRRLQKTTSDTQAMFRPPSLMRSATDSFIKREASEVPLSAFPQLKDSRPPSRSRQPSVQLQHLNRRQVDLNSLSTSSEAKLKRKAAIEDELKDAITAIKKPNRNLAIKDYNEATEQRAFARTSKRKQHPARRILQNVENVQVMATPRNVRKVNVFPEKSTEQTAHEPGDDMLPPSSSCVPASTVRPRSQGSGNREKADQFHPHSKHSSAIAETPSRGSAKNTSFLHFTVSGTPDGKQSISAFKIPSSAIKAMDRVTGIEQTPSKNRLGQPPLVRKSDAFTHIMQTPSKQRSPDTAEAVTLTPVQSTMSADRTGMGGVDENAKESEGRAEKPNESIYDALGWNDDVDELA